MIYQITQYTRPPSALRPAGPLDRIVRRAMHKEAGKRYQSGDEFGEDLIEARRAGLGAAVQAFSDADKFAALRAMRFFAGFTDPELWEVIRIGIWERVAGGNVVVRERRRGFLCVVIDGEMRSPKTRSPQRARSRRVLR
jgi:hypothetical protein